jgi:hypothetical protein
MRTMEFALATSNALPGINLGMAPDHLNSLDRTELFAYSTLLTLKAIFNPGQIV